MVVDYDIKRFNCGNNYILSSIIGPAAQEVPKYTNSLNINYPIHGR